MKMPKGTAVLSLVMCLSFNTIKTINATCKGICKGMFAATPNTRSHTWYVIGGHAEKAEWFLIIQGEAFGVSVGFLGDREGSRKRKDATEIL